MNITTVTSTTTEFAPEYTPHPWHAFPLWKKRLKGWLSYQITSWGALIHPVEADMATYKVLTKQFKKPGTYHLSWEIDMKQWLAVWVKTRNLSGAIEIVECETETIGVQPKMGVSEFWDRWDVDAQRGLGLCKACRDILDESITLGSPENPVQIKTAEDVEKFKHAIDAFWPLRQGESK